MAAPWEQRVVEVFGLENLRNQQKETLQCLLDHRDVFLSCRTGGGKSLCYMAFPTACKVRFGDQDSVARPQPQPQASTATDTVVDIPAPVFPSGEDFILIVSPLNAIMQEQCSMLTALGMSAACLGSDKNTDRAVGEGKHQFIFTSPEIILGTGTGRDMLRSSVFKDKVGLIVVDEAHTVVQW